MRKLILLLFIALFLAACSNDEEVAKETESPTENEQPQESEQEENVTEEPDPEPEYKNTFPLTGVGTNDEVDDRIVGIMINNHTNARPQTGLSQADIVFELLAEGPITRFLALFQSEKPDVVGPVRSAREYYFDLANRYGALYVYHGAAGFVNEMIYNRGIEYIDGYYRDNDGHAFKRESFRVAPHNSYFLMENVYDVAESKGYDVKREYESLPFLDDEEIGRLSGEEANHIEIVYSNNPMEIVEFTYDPASEKYNRYNDREQTVELETDEPIEVDNVFIIEAQHAVIDDVGRRDIDLYAGGDAYLIQKGKIQKLEWENRFGRLIPVKDGESVGFVPGKTWVNVVPTNPGMEQSVKVMNE
ncbi:DUF3048 domain-containing protein [Ornithinibacillus halophilus]|uniref:Lipoprotein YerB n=1 Tax=Ornithinibacillus halophilus TaxID=930117 RepID=A0A1M5ET95_9BACI|nr:DUF3048 domain-containing protein [Ornithinibacillus halophilus]SHF82417.1 Protein of unknown function [Ornithinibacillus halophilus]